MWLITNLNLNEKLGNPKYYTFGFSVYGDALWDFEPNTQTYWYYFGYILFRNNIDIKGNNIKDKINNAIINRQYLKNIIKGKFVFIRFTENHLK